MIEHSDPVEITLPPYEIAVAESVHARDFEMAWRTDEYCKLIMVVRGRTRLEFRGRGAFELRSGCIAPVAANAAHRLADDEPSTVVVLALGSALVEALPARRAVWDSLVLRGPSCADPGTLAVVTTRLRSILHRQHVRASGLVPGDELVVRSQADAILAALCTSDPNHTDRSSRERVRAILDRIAQEPFDEWTREQAATLAGLSVRRFADLQRETTGTSFQRWVTAVRARYAARLIAEGGYTASAAAFAAGFSSLPTFYRVFRREMGQAPGSYATAARDR